MRSSDPAQNVTAIRSNLRKLPVGRGREDHARGEQHRDQLGHAQVPGGHGDPDELGDQGQRVQDEQVGDRSTPQDFPNLSMISRACPTPVTAPSRSTIS